MRECIAPGCIKATRGPSKRECNMHWHRRLKYDTYGPATTLKREAGTGSFNVRLGWRIYEPAHPLARCGDGTIILAHKLLHAVIPRPKCYTCGTQLYWRAKEFRRRPVVVYKDGDKANCVLPNLAALCRGCEHDLRRDDDRGTLAWAALLGVPVNVDKLEFKTLQTKQPVRTSA